MVVVVVVVELLPDAPDEPELAAEASWPRTTITPTLSGWILASLAPVGRAWTLLESSCSWDPMAWALVS